MPGLLKSKTLSVSILSDAAKVYEFVADPLNLPRWATTFCRSVKESRGQWELQTSLGPIKARFSPPNELGVVDHIIIPQKGTEIFVPMRVIPNGSGAEITFTIYQQPGMSAENFAKDVKLVKQDLRTLKKVMEDRTWARNTRT